MWRSSQSSSIRRSYECDYCQRNNVIEKQQRICFLHDVDEVQVIFPVLDEDGNIEGGESVVEEVDVEEFVSRLAEVCSQRPENVFRVMLRFFGGRQGTSNVCPVSVIDPFYSQILNMADRCEVYGSLPCVGSVGDQPNWIMEALDIFRRTKAEYEVERIEEMKNR